MFEGVASVDPRLLTVPLLPCAGWSAGYLPEVTDGIGFEICDRDTLAWCSASALHTLPLPPCAELSTGKG